METTENPAKPISFSNGIEWEHPILVIRDSWDTSGYRLYWTEDEHADGCVQVDGEVDAYTWATITMAHAHCEHRFPGVPVYREQGHGGNMRLLKPLS